MFLHRIFYFLLFVFGLSLFRVLLFRDPKHFSANLLTSILPINTTNFFLWAVVTLVVWSTLILFYLFFEKKILRVLIGLTTLLLYSMLNSFGKETHLFTFFTAASLILALTDLNRTFLSKKEIFVWCQIFLLASYQSAGLWKLRALFDTESIEQLKEILQSYLVVSLAEGKDPSVFLSLGIAEQLLLPGFVVALLFQLFSFVPILSRKFLIPWGFGAALFHLSTGLTINIWFYEQAVGALFFLVIIPFLDRPTDTQINSTSKGWKLCTLKGF